LKPFHDSGDTNQFEAFLTTLKRTSSRDVRVSKFTGTCSMSCEFVNDPGKEATVFTDQKLLDNLPRFCEGIGSSTFLQNNTFTDILMNKF
jgi:hypothetical protein